MFGRAVDKELYFGVVVPCVTIVLFARICSAPPCDLCVETRCLLRLLRLQVKRRAAAATGHEFLRMASALAGADKVRLNAETFA